MRLSLPAQALIWCFLFLILDSVQAVFLGGVLQSVDSFLLAGLVFGLPALTLFLWLLFTNPGQISLTLRHPSALLGLNISTAGAWITYLLAVQRIEPAVAFAVFSGLIPLTTVFATRLGFAEATVSRNAIERLGLGVIALAVAWLAGITIFGYSGFVRGGPAVAFTGVALAVLSGALISFMLLYSKRLHGVGVAPSTQFVARFPLFLVLALLGALAGVDAKSAVAPGDLVRAVLIGFVVLAFAIYAVQRAVSLTSSLTVASIAATAPLLIFILQRIEGRVMYSDMTMAGLVIYFSGALVAALGTSKALSDETGRS